ncbi:MAG TPA: murein L,D-transpeptidase, partial [Bradyrhizobium sp.]
MRDSSMGRGGFDRVLMAVAATFLTVSATSALAQSNASRSAAELAIEAAIPIPQPANVPPPTADDFKIDTTASVPPKQIELPRVNANTDAKPADAKPAETTAAA